MYSMSNAQCKEELGSHACGNVAFSIEIMKGLPEPFLPLEQEELVQNLLLDYAPGALRTQHCTEKQACKLLLVSVESVLA